MLKEGLCLKGDWVKAFKQLAMQVSYKDEKENKMPFFVHVITTIQR